MTSTPAPRHTIDHDGLVALDAMIVRSRGDDPRERRACARGELVRVAPGRYVPTPDWDALRPEERSSLLTLARVPRLHEDVIVSHLSAAALWGLPLLGTAWTRTSVIDPHRDRTRSETALVRHAPPVALSSVPLLGGLRLTSPARTLVDVALSSSRSQAVAALDAALRLGLATRADYVDELAASGRERGGAVATWVGWFADPLAQSAGESVERVVLDGLGFPAPVLQREHYDAQGLIGYTDFAWPEHGVLAEFDGRRKYLDREYRGDLSTEEVVLDEKDRENRLRALDGTRGFVRSVWRELYLPGHLLRAFTRAGLPRVRVGHSPRARSNAPASGATNRTGRHV